MSKKVIIEIDVEDNQTDKSICKDAIEALNSRLLIVKRLQINDVVRYDYTKGGFIKEEIVND